MHDVSGSGGRVPPPYKSGSRTLPAKPPSPHGVDGPYGFDNSERPGALKKAVDRSHRARRGESENINRRAAFAGVTEHHGGDRDEAEPGQSTHANAGLSEFFGPDEGDEQINEQSKRHGSNNDVFIHDSESPARVTVRDADREKSKCDADEN
jgi:hypothetical protein